MHIRLFVISLLALLSVAATAENYIVNQAYEIAVSELRLPGNVVGSVTFKDCDRCEPQTIRVTTETQYLLNNRTVSLADFRDALKTIADKQNNIATVIHHLESDAIVAVHVFEKGI